MHLFGKIRKIRNRIRRTGAGCLALYWDVCYSVHNHTNHPEGELVIYAETSDVNFYKTDSVNWGFLDGGINVQKQEENGLFPAVRFCTAA